jgi:hypothetical protein
MIRAFRAGFYPTFLFLVMPWLLSSQAFCGDWARTVESKVAELQKALGQCIQKEELCESQNHETRQATRQWMEIRWQGATRLVRPLDSSQRLDSRLVAMPFPPPTRAGEDRVWVLGVAQGWDRPRILIEKAVSAHLSMARSIALITELNAELKGSPGPDSTLRQWILSSEGEVLFQSEGNFIGSVLKDSEHFANPTSQTSFDQLRVTPEWSSLPGLQWWALEESIQELPMTVAFHERFWKWISNWGVSLFKATFLCAILVLVLSVGYLLRAVFRWTRAYFAQPNSAEDQLVESTPLEVTIPQVIQASRAPDLGVTNSQKSSQKNWMNSVLKSRSFLELGRRLMVILAEESESPVVFLEFHRDSSMALFRDQVGIQDHLVPVSMRIPVSDLAGRFHEQPAFQNVLLHRLGVSHFEVLELRAPQGSGLRPQLLGLFVLLAPGVKSFENKSNFERLLAQAGRYHDAILRPAPPQLRQ